MFTPYVSWLAIPWVLLHSGFFISILIADRIAVKHFKLWKVNLSELIIGIAGYSFYWVTQ